MTESDLWADEPFSVQLGQIGKEARLTVRRGVQRAGLLPSCLPPVPDEQVYLERALIALDAIRLGVEGRLHLKGHALSADGVTTVVSDVPIPMSNARIVRAAKRALKGQTRRTS